jgi:CheY-like chemotaxis protein
MRTVLIVDDDEQARVALELAIATLPNVQITSASNGADAMTILSDEGAAVDMVVTDLNLPTINGFELVKLLRSNDNTLHIPIVVVTADGSPDTPERLEALGVDAVFLKPFSTSQLRSALKGLLYGS